MSKGCERRGYEGEHEIVYFEMEKLVVARHPALAGWDTCPSRSGKSFPKKEKTFPNFFLDKIKNQEEDGSHKKTNFRLSTSDLEYEIGFVTDCGSEGPKKTA